MVSSYCQILSSLFKGTTHTHKYWSNYLDQYFRISRQWEWLFILPGNFKLTIEWCFSPEQSKTDTKAAPMLLHGSSQLLWISNRSKEQSCSTLTDALRRPLPISFTSCWRSRVVDHYDWLHYWKVVRCACSQIWIIYAFNKQQTWISKKSWSPLRCDGGNTDWTAEWMVWGTVCRLTWFLNAVISCFYMITSTHINPL